MGGLLVSTPVMDGGEKENRSHSPKHHVKETIAKQTSWANHGEIVRKWLLFKERQRQIVVFNMGMATKVVITENLYVNSHMTGNCHVTTTKLDFWILRL